MTESRLREHALALPGVSEKSILERSMFQVRGRTFATENWPEAGWAVVKLPVSDQRAFGKLSVAVKPEPERGAAGITLLRLVGLDDELLADILTAAWRLAYGAEKPRPTRATAAAAAMRTE